MLPQARPVRWPHYAILASVALNLFLIAFLAAQAWQVRQPGPWQGLANAGGGMVGDGLAQLAARLPAGDAALLRTAFAARRSELFARQRQWLGALEQVRADIARQPYDHERLRQDLAAARETRQQIAPVLEAILLEVLPQMSDAGRLQLSQHRLVPRRPEQRDSP